MKTKKFLMLLAAVLLSCASAMAQNSPLKGDVNGDGKVDVADIVAILDIMKNGTKEIQSIEWVNTTASSTYGQPINLPKIKLINSDNSTSQINGNASGVTYSTTLTSSTEAGTYLITATYQGKTTTNTLNYTIIPATTYYWYVGQTDPSTMTEISPIVDDLTSPGWRLIGTSLPNYNSSNMLWSSSNTIGLGSKTTWYLALPSNNIKVYSAGIDLTNDLLTSNGTKVINGVTYYLYTSKGTTRNLGYDLY